MFQSLLVYRLCFSADKVGLQRGATKYNRLRRNPSELEDASLAADGYLSISSEEEPDPDEEIISHLCEMSNQQNSEWSNLLDTVENGYQNYLPQNVNFLNY